MIDYKLNRSNKITILFLSWRDIKSPKSGGAEIFTHEMLKRLNFNTYRVIHLSPMFENAKSMEIIDNITYLRCGNIISVINYARKFYEDYDENIDYVVDQCNTHRFFTAFWVTNRKRIFFIHQLTRDIWFKNTRFPLNVFGYLTETIFLRMNKNDYTITVSHSTKKDLLNIGFDKNKVFILPEGIEFKHWLKKDFYPKKSYPIFGYVGRFSSYKGIDDTIKAYSIIKRQYLDSKLWIIGKTNRKYMDEVLIPILNKENLSYGEKGQDRDVIFYGFLPQLEKLKLMSQMKALIFPSRREGWGLTITEAAAVGTPSIVYNSHGLVDAVNFGQAGYLCSKNNIENLSENMKKVIEDEKKYDSIRQSAYDFSFGFKWDNTSKKFDEFISLIRRVE